MKTSIIAILMAALLLDGCCGPPGSYTYETDLCYYARGETPPPRSGSESYTVDFYDSKGRPTSSYRVDHTGSGTRVNKVWEKKK